MRFEYWSSLNKTLNSTLLINFEAKNIISILKLGHHYSNSIVNYKEITNLLKMLSYIWENFCFLENLMITKVGKWDSRIQWCHYKEREPKYLL